MKKLLLSDDNYKKLILALNVLDVEMRVTPELANYLSPSEVRELTSLVKSAETVIAIVVDEFDDDCGHGGVY